MLNNRAFITESETLALIKYTKKATDDIVEVGTYAVGTAENVGQHTPKGLAWWAVDIFQTSTDSKNPIIAYAQHLAQYGNIFCVQGDSREMGTHWNSAIGFLFIDGSHYVDDVRRDFAAWTPWLVPDGIAALHDARGFDHGKVSPKFPSLNGYDLIHERGPEAIADKAIASGEWCVVEIVDTIIFLTRVKS